jgi:hypothetical protein
VRVERKGGGALGIQRDLARLARFLEQYENQWNLLMAGAVVAAFPVVMLFRVGDFTAMIAVVLYAPLVEVTTTAELLARR